MLPQPGIFALGTSAHCYLTFDIRPGVTSASFVSCLAALHAPEHSIGAVNLVVGLRPELWVEIVGVAAPPGVVGFNDPVRGPDGYVMPATQHDGWVWLSGAGQDLVFDAANVMVEAVHTVALIAEEVFGWNYLGNRDLTGFIDGTENPALSEAPGVAVIAAGEPGAGSSVVLVQSWQHRSSDWRALDQSEQERVIGRTKPDSVELAEEVMPIDSHVARTVVEADGEELEIFRRNTSFGGVRLHGTTFVGFCARQSVLQVMLERMAGVGDGIRDALTRYSEPLTGAYYVVPSLEALTIPVGTIPGG